MESAELTQWLETAYWMELGGARISGLCNRSDVVEESGQE